MRRAILCAVFGFVVVLVSPGTRVGAADDLSATLDGESIPLVEVGSHPCHDFDYPILRCFDTVAELNADLASRTHRLSGSANATSAAGTAAASAASTGYVIVYEHTAYGGVQLVMTQVQAWLSSIGWNDRISSFKSFGATGNFREDSPAGGFIYSYGSASRVPVLNGTYNDKFSAFYIN